MGKAKWLLNLLVTAAALASLGLAAGQKLVTSGDFSYKATEMKRLANCAGTIDVLRQEGKGFDAGGCKNIPLWDDVYKSSIFNSYSVTIDAKRVPYRSDNSCPVKYGPRYVKCFYIGGKFKGNPVVTISSKLDTNWLYIYADWYYL